MKLVLDLTDLKFIVGTYLQRDKEIPVEFDTAEFTTVTHGSFDEQITECTGMVFTVRDPK